LWRPSCHREDVEHVSAVGIVSAGGALVYSAAVELVARRPMARLLARGIGRPGAALRAAAFALLLHVTACVAGAALLVFGGQVRDAHGGSASWWLLLPAVLVCGPWVWLLLPSRVGGYADLRTALARQHVGEAPARAFAWLGGPFAAVETMMFVAGFVITFQG
jgi:hypothetical protein